MRCNAGRREELPMKTNVLKTISTLFITAVLSSACTTMPVEEPGTEYGNQLGAVPYEVRAGDNLVLIASEQTRASDNWRRIADFNLIRNPAQIKVGQTIWIPNDLIPLNVTENKTRSVPGQPDAVVNSVSLPPKIRPIR